MVIVNVGFALTDPLVAETELQSSETILDRQFPESLERVFDYPSVHAVSDSDMSRFSEASSRYCEDVFYLQRLDENNIVVNGTPREKVECTHWFHHQISEICEVVIEEVPFFLIL